MTWSEKWRNQDRPDADQIPDKYSLSSTVADNKMIGYFVGVIILSYVTLKLWGATSMLIAGIPLLMWLTVGISALVIVGLYMSVSQRDVSRDETPMPMEQEVNDD